MEKDPSVDRLLLDRAEKPLHHPVGLTLLQEGKARSNSPVAELSLEMVREVLRPVIHAKAETVRLGAGAIREVQVLSREVPNPDS